MAKPASQTGRRRTPLSHRLIESRLQLKEATPILTLRHVLAHSEGRRLVGLRVSLHEEERPLREGVLDDLEFVDCLIETRSFLAPAPAADAGSASWVVNRPRIHGLQIGERGTNPFGIVDSRG